MGSYTGNAVHLTSGAYYNGTAYIATLANGSGRVVAGGGNLGGVVRLQAAAAVAAGSALSYTADISLNLGGGATTLFSIKTPKIYGWANYVGTDLGARGGLVYNAGYTVLSTNAYDNGAGWLFKEAGWATDYYQDSVSGFHIWRVSTAAGSAADTAVTWNQGMLLDSTMSLGLGVAPSLTRLAIRQTSTYGISLSTAAQEYTARIESGIGNALVIGNRTTSTDLLTLSGSGNLGLGVTPQAWGSTHRALEVAGASTGHIVAYVNGINLGANYYNNGTNDLYASSGQSAQKLSLPVSGGYQFNIASNGTPGTAITWTQAMLLDSSGNLGLGLPSAGARLHVARNDAVGTEIVRVQNSHASRYSSAMAFTSAPGLDWRIGKGAFYQDDAFGIGLYSGTELLVLTSQGRLGIGTHAPDAQLRVDSANASRGINAVFVNNTGTSGSQLSLSASGVRSWAFGVNGQGHFVWALDRTTASDGSESMRLETSGGLCIGTSANYPGNASTLCLYYQGIGNSYGLSLNTPDTSATPSRALNFLAGGNQTGGGSYTVRGFVSQSSDGIQFNASNNLRLQGAAVVFETGGLARAQVDAAGVLSYQGTEVGWRGIPNAVTTGGTAAIAERGKMYVTTGGITVPASVFGAGDTFSIYNNSASSITVTQGASLTLRLAGTTSTGNRTLVARGICTVTFISATEAIISGAGVA